MAVPKWYLIAKNEYKILTSSFPRFRYLFPFVVMGIIAFITGYLVPMAVESFVTEIEAFIFSVAAIAVVQIVLFLMFVYFLTFPISLALRDVKADQNEIFLSAPIKPSDVLLGKFVGLIPIYAIVITVIAGIFTAVLDPLGIDPVQKVIIVIIFIFTTLSGLWIGTVITAFLRTKLGKTARGRDIGKALGILIALPLVAIMYALMGGGVLEALADPNTSESVRNVFNILPSSWGAEIIIKFALNPGNIGAIWFETFTNVGGLIAFFIAILFLGKSLANRVLSLEQITFSGSTAKPDGMFYNTIRAIGGRGSFGTLLVTMFKDFSRRLQNITWIIYVLGLMVMLFILIIRPEDPSDIIIMSNFIYPMLAAVVVGDITIRGKENLFIYRKTPNGEDRFVRARLIQSLLIVVPIVAVISIVSISLAPNTSIYYIFTFMGYSILAIIANTQLALGVFLLIPAFSEKSGEFIANVMAVAFTNMIMFIVLLIFFGFIMGMTYFLLLLWLIGFCARELGIRNLKRIE